MKKKTRRFVFGYTLLCFGLYLMSSYFNRGIENFSDVLDIVIGIIFSIIGFNKIDKAT